MGNLIDWVRKEIFSQLWQHYNQLVPYGPMIMAAMQSRGDVWIEDHVAYRTLPGANTGSHILERVFEILGYEHKDNYFFDSKQLKAFWMSPPDVHEHTSLASPKIFLSELIPDKFSPEFQSIISRLSLSVVESPLPRIEHLAASTLQGSCVDALELVKECVALFTSGPSWSRPTIKDYQTLGRESEYAAWTMLYGHQINHFTLSAHLMNSFTHLASLADFIEKTLLIPMNHSGGLIKGSPELLLEQVATMASSYDYVFQDGVQEVPYGFVEFAYRHTLPGAQHDGAWQSYYQGFVTSNADKIFESTNQHNRT